MSEIISLEDILKEQGEISVHCHYCNTDYKFGQEDIDYIEKLRQNKV